MGAGPVSAFTVIRSAIMTVSHCALHCIISGSFPFDVDIPSNYVDPYNPHRI